MKKLIYIFLLLPFLSIGQTTNGTETKANAFRALSPQTVTTSSFITSTGADGTQGKILGENISLGVVPTVTHFTPLSASIKGYFQGVDDAIGNLPATTAGSTTRLWYTADPVTITAGTFYKTNFTGKGAAASAIQSVVNDDNQKKYFTQDLIGDAYVTATTFPKGVYAANLSASTSPNSANQQFTIEVYKCNTNGTPIASGVTGAVIGDLGVTVIGILDSGLLKLADNSVTNVPLSTTIAYAFTINVGERVRYHISAAKVGTDASNITESVYFGTSYNSYIDIPVPLNTDNITNLSTVTGVNVTAALDNLKNSIPTSFTQIVYVNATNPNAATIFDLNNPPVTNNNALKADVTNLYIGTDASNWVYNSTTVNYVTKAITASASNFYFEGTPTDAQGNKTAAIERSGTVGGAQGTASNHFVTKAQLDTKFNTPIGLTANYLPKWNGSGFRNSIVQEIGSYLHINGGISTNAISGIKFNNGGSWDINTDDTTFNISETNMSTHFTLNKTTGLLTIKALQVNGLAGSGNALATITSTGKLTRGASVPLRYVALMSQVSTNAPTVTVLENTLGGTVVWTRNSTGVYWGTLSGAFVVGKTTMFVGNTVIDSITAYGPTLNVIAITTETANTLVKSDGLLNVATVKVEVYP